MKIDTATLSSVHRHKLVQQPLGYTSAERRKNYAEFLNVINEPIRRIEFNVLYSMYNQDYRPYQRMDIITTTYCDYGDEKTTWFVSVPKSQLDTLVLLSSNGNNDNVNFETINFEFNDTRVIFKYKEFFKYFSNKQMTRHDALYEKLFGIAMDNRIKVLYYFLSKYKYDFLETISSNEKLCHEMRLLDDYFCFRGYHKRVIEEAILSDTQY